VVEFIASIEPILQLEQDAPSLQAMQLGSVQSIDKRLIRRIYKLL
jgi:hypothetical protein